MTQRTTTVAERNRFIDLKLSGYTLQEIADETGWTHSCVRTWWRALRAYRDSGRKALDPPDGRKQHGGRMSTFPATMRFACLRLKLAHPGWGAEVVRPRVAHRLDVPETELPSVSTIEKYWAQFGERLYRRYRKRRSSATSECGPAPQAPHERWQADFAAGMPLAKEHIPVAGVGNVDVLNIRDTCRTSSVRCEYSPVKRGTRSASSGLVSILAATFRTPCAEFIVENAQQMLITCLRPKQLTVTTITGLSTS